MIDQTPRIRCITCRYYKPVRRHRYSERYDGVYAGLHCKLSSDLRIVRAPQKPQNLMCGKWVGVDEQ